MFTPRNGNARELLKQGKFLKDIKRKLCANKGYIGKACRKRSIPTHSERLNPSSFTAKLALKSA